MTRPSIEGGTTKWLWITWIPLSHLSLHICAWAGPPLKVTAPDPLEVKAGEVMGWEMICAPTALMAFTSGQVKIHDIENSLMICSEVSRLMTDGWMHLLNCRRCGPHSELSLPSFTERWWCCQLLSWPQCTLHLLPSQRSSCTGHVGKLCCWRSSPSCCQFLCWC